jgi:ribonuclease J
MTVNRLIYLPLGGAGEIGMNCYVYGYGPEDKERLIVVDLGVTFPDMDATPGVDLIMADIAWLEKRRDRIEAVFITHAHEDHIGALGLLWPRLKVPVYARRYAKHGCAGWSCGPGVWSAATLPALVQGIGAYPLISY